MAKLFTRFGRITTRENSGISGTGLGLYPHANWPASRAGTSPPPPRRVGAAGSP
jgi:hypothetical protein